MQNQRGLTLIELVVVVAIAALMVGATLVLATPWIARESMRSGVNEMASFVQLTKIESVSRNRECRFIVDKEARTMEIWDTWTAGDSSDDERIHLQALPSAVHFARPDSGDVITLQQIPGTERYQAVLGADGMVNEGTGTVFLYGGDKYGAEAVVTKAERLHRKP